MFTIYKDEISLGTEFYEKFIFTGWFILCSINVVTLFVGSLQTKEVQEFFIKWQHLQNEFPCINVYSYIKQKSKIAVAIGWIAILLNMLFVTYAMFWTDVIDLYISPFEDRNGTFQLVVKILSMIAHFYLTCAWILQIAI